MNQENLPERLKLRRTHPETMSVLVRTIARSLLPVVTVFAIYIISYGHLTPGGGFQGGMILVGAVMTFYLAYGYRVLRRYPDHALELVEAGAILAFLAIGLAGLFGGSFFDNLLKGGIRGTLLSGGFVPLLNFVVGLKVAAGTLFVVIILVEALRKGED